MVILVMKEANRCGFHVALIPGRLDARQIKEAFEELAVKPTMVYEIEEWQEAANGVRMGFVPLPQVN